MAAKDVQALSGKPGQVMALIEISHSVLIQGFYIVQR